MANLKERITKAVDALEKTRKAQKAAEAVRRTNTAFSELARNAKEIERQKSS